MKMVFITFIFVMIFNCCHHSSNKNVTEVSYPVKIIEKELQALYDTARWIIYSSNYHNDGLKCYELDSTAMSFGHKDYLSNYEVENANIVSFSLKLEQFFINQDTTVFIFSIYFKDTFEVCFPKQEAYQNTVIFIEEDDFIYRTGEFGYNKHFLMQQKELEKDLVLENNYEKVGYYSLKKESILFPKFLKTTKHPLHPWLKKEAIKRGILQE